MELEICRQCKYYWNNIEYDHLCTYNHRDGKGFYLQCRLIMPDYYENGHGMCHNFIHKKTKQTKQYLPSIKRGIYGHYEVNYGDDKMDNDSFTTILRSKNQKTDKILSFVKIDCENYETFKQVVEAVMPILEKEDIKKECD